MSKQAFYNGILYTIEYKPELSNNDYTQHKVYHIKTDEMIKLWQENILITEKTVIVS